MSGYTRIEFSLSSPEHLFVRASHELGCRLEMEENVPRGDGNCTEFFTVTDATPDRVIELTTDQDHVEARTLSRWENGGVIELEVSDDCPVLFLAERGALPTDVYSANGEGRIVAEVPPVESAAVVMEAFLDAHPDAEPVGTHVSAAAIPGFLDDATAELGETELTPRQRDVLSAANEAGYYDWPRTTNGKELADRLDISPPTMHKHLRAAERKLVATYVDSRSRESE